MSVELSVVIPTFRRPRELLEALRSVQAQSGVELEVLVLDDSPEGSAQQAVASLGDSRVRYIQREVPTGGKPSIVRNEGAAQARGRYLHFLDDDDVMVPGVYRAYLDALEARRDRGMVFGVIEPFGEDPAALVHERRFFAEAARRARLGARVAGQPWLALQQNFRPTLMVNSACVVRKECFESVGGYAPDIRLVEDVDFWGRVIRSHGGIFLDRVVLRYRVSSSSIMHGRSDDSAVHQSYRLMHQRYRSDHGLLEYAAMKVLARTLGRWL